MKRFIVLFYALFQSNVSVSIVISSNLLRISKDSPNNLHWNYGHNGDFTFDRFQQDWLLKFYKFQSLPPIQSNDQFEKGKFIIIDRFTPKLIITIDKFAIILCSLKFFLVQWNYCYRQISLYCVNTVTFILISQFSLYN